MIKENPLGKATNYSLSYSPDILYQLKREEVSTPCREFGHDLWRCYEFSYLLESGTPVSAVCLITVPASSPMMVESKSVKLYLGSYHFLRFSSEDEVIRQLKDDLSAKVEAHVEVSLLSITSWCKSQRIPTHPFESITAPCSFYEERPMLLEKSEQDVLDSQTVLFDCVRTVCPVTGQPDWATVLIHFSGRTLKKESLFRYLVSLRSHHGYHEACTEVILEALCGAAEATYCAVRSFFTRRGGIDITPMRSTFSLECTEHEGDFTDPFICVRQ